ncbi:MAG: chromate transporter [Oscillospiraceae bacterium]|nr:chromate transporter [Oscillospiraceae bacterium]
MNVLLQLFFGFARIGAISFGGGHASIPLVQREVVEVQGWLTYEEFGNLLALDELTPGPILINSATFVGSRIAGMPGAIVASLGSIAPACVITMLLIFLLHKYRKLEIINEMLFAVKCMAVGLILVTILRMAGSVIFLTGDTSGIDYLLLVMTIAAFIVLRKLQLSPLLIMLACGAIELTITYFLQ